MKVVYTTQRLDDDENYIHLEMNRGKLYHSTFWPTKTDQQLKYWYQLRALFSVK